MLVMVVVSKMHAGGVEVAGGACKMAATCSSSSRWSRGVVGKEEGDVLRTVECLRGRLQAERVASRVAKEESDLMAKRLTELEKLLAIEIKARNRAKKRMECALKKLQSLKLIDVPDLSDVSGNTLGDSSSASTSSLKMPGKEEPSSQAEDSGQCGGKGGSVFFSADSARQSVSQETCWSSAGSVDSVNNDDPCPVEDIESKKISSVGELITDDSTRQSSSSLEEKDQNIHEIDRADDAIASVPAILCPDSENSNQSINSKTRIEKIETETERKLIFANSKWQLDNIAKDVLVGRRVIVHGPIKLRGL